MGTIGRVFAGIAVVIGILFGICVMMGACGYNIHGSITDHGKKVVGFGHQAGYQGELSTRHRQY